MSVRDNYTMINIREYLALGTDEEVGEPALVRLLSDFSCPKNPDVEHFLKKNAIEFTKKNQSVTYLIAQLGKNFAEGRNNRITGAEMLELAWSVIEEMQYMGGGMVVFLEANNDDKLLKYYNDNRFSQFDIRQTTSKDQEPHELVQLLRLL